MTVARGAIHLHDVRKSFRAYHASSVKETLVRLARGEPLTERRLVLDGVSLDVAPGERIAIVGKNGAGKSTLFRLMSGIMIPDGGAIAIGGRVSPLIEITAGLVLDLTGAENIRLNGVLLGLTRRDVDRRFDAIAAFAGLEDFLETPVRYYSSGMLARLGFAIAVHVDADILLIDEVLAVGDVDFQQRSLEHMLELNRAGVTVVLVSHDFDAVRSFCPRTVHLAGGRVIDDGPTERVLRSLTTASATEAAAAATETSRGV